MIRNISDIKKALSIIAATLLPASINAQTMNIEMSSVTTIYQMEQTGEMVFDNDGKNLTIDGKIYSTDSIGQITFGNDFVADNTVSINYSDTTASVVVAGNVAQYLTVTVSRADVSIVQSADLPDEITYTLSGTATDGSFYMDGETKATIVLDGVTLTSLKGGAVTIDNGKRISIIANDETTNSFADAANGLQKACFFVNGHAEWSGTGKINITGNCKHGYFSDEYTWLTETFGTMNILSAAGDGLHINQYFQMDGGTVNVSNVQGDGIDVGANLTGELNDGQMMLNGGTLTVSVTANAVKGLKADSAVTVSGGNITVTTTGNAIYDSTVADISSSAALKTGGTFTMTDGTLTLTSTGSGGKGINATGDIGISGGTLYVTTTGTLYQYDATNDSKAQAIKTDGNITISGGSVYSLASSDQAKAFKTDYSFYINGGTVLGISAKNSEPTGGTQSYKSYKSQNIKGGETITYDGVSYTVPAIYTNTSARVIVSAAK